MVKFGSEQRSELILSGIAVVVFALLFWLGQTKTEVAPSDKVAIWQDIKQAANKAGLKPEFVYAICVAESSLNPRADSGYAKGLMQLSNVAWKEVSDRSYREAFNPKVNVEVGAAYLNYLKGFLKEHDAFSYANLAASYRYGPFALKKVGFDRNKLEKPHNKIYQELFAGNTSPVPIPVSG